MTTVITANTIAATRHDPEGKGLAEIIDVLESRRFSALLTVMLISIAIPVYNEREALPELLASLHRVMASLEHDYEIVFVDDGSVDGTAQILENAAAADPRIKVLFFSRNFGHQIAITAALDHASGER